MVVKKYLWCHQWLPAVSCAMMMPSAICLLQKDMPDLERDGQAFKKGAPITAPFPFASTMPINLPINVVQQVSASVTAAS